MNANSNEVSDNSKLKNDYNYNNNSHLIINDDDFELPTHMDAIVQTKSTNLVNGSCQTDNKIFCDVGIQCNLKNNDEDIDDVEQEQRQSYNKGELIQISETEFVFQSDIEENNNVPNTCEMLSSSSTATAQPRLRQKSVIKSVDEIIYETFLELNDVQIIYDVLLALMTFDHFNEQQTKLCDQIKTIEFKTFLINKILIKHYNDFKDKVYHFLQKITIPMNVIQKYKLLKTEHQKDFIDKICEQYNENLFNYKPINYVQKIMWALCNLKSNNDKNTFKFSDVISRSVNKNNNKNKKSNQPNSKTNNKNNCNQNNNNNNTNYLANVSSIATTSAAATASGLMNKDINYNVCQTNNSSIFNDFHLQQHLNQLPHHDQTNSYNSSQLIQNNFNQVYNNGNNNANNRVTTINQNNNMNSTRYTNNNENNNLYSTSTLSSCLEYGSGGGDEYHQYQQQQQHLPLIPSSTFLSPNFYNSPDSTITEVSLSTNELPSMITTNYNLNINAVISALPTTHCSNNSNYSTNSYGAQIDQATVPNNVFLQQQLQQKRQQQQQQRQQQQQQRQQQQQQRQQQQQQRQQPQYSQQQRYGNQYHQHRHGIYHSTERAIYPN